MSNPSDHSSAIRRASYPKRRGISRTILLGGLGGLIIASLSAFGIWAAVNVAPDRSQQLNIAVRLMKKGDVGAAARIAESIPTKELKRKADVSKREFLIGADARLQAEGIQQRRIAIAENERAVKHLEASRSINFPQGYEGLGNYYLGMALYDLFRWEDARDPLEIAAERWPQGRNDAIERLVDIDLSSEAPDPEAALERIEHWKSLPAYSSVDKDRATVKEMETRYVKGDFADSVALSDQISVDSPLRPAAELVKGRSLFRMAITSSPTRREELLEETKDCFDHVIASPRITVSIRRLSNLELGRTLRAMGRTTQAISTLSALRLSSPYEAESLAGAVEEIDSLIDLNRHGDAISTLEHVTKNFGEMQWYQNDWNPLSQIRQRFVAAGKRVLDKNDFSNAAQFANWLPPVCEELDGIDLKARTYEKWANALRDAKNKRNTGQKKTPVDNSDDGQIERFHKIAGEAYEKLANKQLRSPEFGDLLWRSIDNYRLASCFNESNRMLNQYLQLESREKVARGLLLQARNHAALNERDKAMKSLDLIIYSHANSPLIYEARLEAARIHESHDDYDEAEKLMVENLYYGDLKPESPMWRESLIELGNLLYMRGEKLQSQARSELISTGVLSQELMNKFERSFNELLKGTDRIEEGLRRFQDEPRRFQMLYTTARAYRMAAYWPDLLLRENRILNEEAIAGMTAKKKELLTLSRNSFSNLRREISSSPDALRMDPNAESHLRNSYFGEADLLFDAESFEDAMTAYRDAANRFINEPESLEALIRISNCQKKLGRTAESKRTLEMAKDVLDRIPEDKDQRFVAVTRHDRKGWNDEIAWLLTNYKGNTASQ